jgi:hypothetical protein
VLVRIQYYQTSWCLLSFKPHLCLSYHEAVVRSIVVSWASIFFYFNNFVKMLEYCFHSGAH